VQEEVGSADFTLLLNLACGPDGEYCCVRATFRFSADVDFLDIEACGEEVLTQCIHGTVVRGRDGVRERFAVGTLEESEKNAALRLHATGKLAKNERQFTRRQMDHGIPSEDAGQMSVRNSHRPERCHSKACRRKTASRLVDEDGHQIDAFNVYTMVREKGRPVARAAAGIDGWAAERLTPAGDKPLILLMGCVS
jgi:hypothetical protein